MTLRVGEMIEVEPEKLVAGGESLSRLDGLPLFVAGIYPGDRARVRVTEAKRGFARGELVELLAASPLRRAEPCEIARTCGGCDWTELRLDAQLKAKRAILEETLRRIGKLDAAILPPIELHVSPLNYRLRSRLHVDATTRRVGFFAMRSHDVVDLSPECEVVGPAVVAQLDEVKRLALDAQRATVSLFESGEQLIVDAHDEDEPRHGVERLIEAGGHRFELSSSSFFQVNRHLLGSLLTGVEASATAVADRDLAFDLYGGVGFFAAPLARYFQRVVTVESSPSSRFARKNAGTNVDGVRADVKAFLARETRQPSFTMIDPPRAGAEGEVIEAIASMTRERICYLSCDPVTFARDASRLWRHGWRPASLAIFDLFPNTHHIETLSSFVRAR